MGCAPRYTTMENSEAMFSEHKEKIKIIQLQEAKMAQQVKAPATQSLIPGTHDGKREPMPRKFGGTHVPCTHITHLPHNSCN